MRCEMCGRETDMVEVTDKARCWQCVNLLDAMQELWDVLAESQALYLANAVGHGMRLTIERNVP